MSCAMWIFMNDSFLSIVSDQEKPGNLLVRARIKGDIERVFTEAKVSHTPDFDYYYRASLPGKEVAGRMAELITSIDYSNFKNSVKDHSRHNAYFDVWDVMREEGDRSV